MNTARWSLQPSLKWQCTAANVGPVITLSRVYTNITGAHPESSKLLASTMLPAQLPDMQKLYKSMASLHRSLQDRRLYNTSSVCSLSSPDTAAAGQRRNSQPTESLLYDMHDERCADHCQCEWWC